MKIHSMKITRLILAVALVAVSFQSAHAESNEKEERYIVRFSDDDDIKKEERDYKSKGIKVERSISRAFKGLIGSFTQSQVNELRKNPKLLYLEKDGPVYTTNFFPTPVNVNPVASWGLDRINQRNLPLDNSYSYQYDGAGVKVYVIDTGINATHSEFTGRVLPGNSQITDGNGTNDCNGHGTHVAGTIAGSKYGVAKASKLVPVRVLDCTGAGTFSGVIAGIDWVLNDHQAGEPAVANLSLGGGFSAAVNDAIARLISDGVVVSVAAGNSNANACNSSPSSARDAITVGATESRDARATYSNFGPCLDLFAPGSSIVSSWIGSNTATNTINGTSMASPHVAGVAALLLEKTPNATPLQIRDILVALATPNKVSNSGNASPNLLLATDTAGVISTPVITIPATPTITSIISGNRGQLTIQGRTTSNGGAPIQRFTVKLYVSSNGSLPFNLVQTIQINTSQLNFSVNVRNLVSRSFYAATVSATNSVGSTADSAFSNQVQVR